MIRQAMRVETIWCERCAGAGRREDKVFVGHGHSRRLVDGLVRCEDCKGTGRVKCGICMERRAEQVSEDGIICVPCQQEIDAYRAAHPAGAEA